ncbi:YaaW family protein [Stutzerimonas nitrititolerans]|uniref:DUF3944 domain-containing protein n=1 Tax=Stutzerimonas nitrititolerans TaxID=2482751 RepID=A0AA41WKM9_9GAMM|nr:DUF3944 domain-containing protein [Stutzerimonas nitrititolerans]MBT1119859.1 DUF3944 domain-containing protein [Stutzerimonas nitrititolerans]MCO7546272.1 DUF3944 domain-containing protein [Stutzerimonas nitrititolerans]
MAYRYDPDLEFLGEMTSKDLTDLVDALTKDKNGENLWTEELTVNASYKVHYPNHAKYWQLIAAELQCFGANSLMTIFRGGKGVLYREILADVANKAGAKNIERSDKALDIEDKILSKLLGDAIDKMTESERNEFAKLVGATNLKNFTPAALTGAAQIIFKSGGFKSFQLTLMVANAVSRALFGRGLALAGNAALMRTAAVLTGPVGWALTGAWTAVDIAGPAFRVTLPAVIQVALLRKKHQAERDGLLEEINSII